MESSEAPTDRENYLTAYIQKQETLLLDYLRKNIDAEIKLVAYTTSYKDVSGELESTKNELKVQVDLLNQATRGLEAVTVEKNTLASKEQQFNNKIQQCENRIRELENNISNMTNEHRRTADELVALRNSTQNSSHETEEIRRELQRTTEELNTVYRENEELKAKLPQPKKVIKKETVTLPKDEF